jgi:CubicO group peptidase (beta-lactamase class C family)
MRLRHSWLALPIISVAANLSMADNKPHLAQHIGGTLPPHVGACVLAIDHGKIICEYSDGVADLESKTPCNPTTNFRLASVSKQFTATAVLLLVDHHQLALSDKLTKFFPGFPHYGEAITVEQLLTHTSGLPAYEDLIPTGATLQLDDYDVLHLLMDTKAPRFPAGQKFEYSNSGYTLLGLIVEAVSRRPFHEFVGREIFQPLAMNDSVLYQRGLNEVPHRAYGHERRDDDWILADQSLTSAVRGDGGVYTSLRDYRKWLASIDEQRLLSAESYRAMFAPHVITDRHGSSYGYGWVIDEYRGEPRIHHHGETQGFRSCVQRFPKRQAAIFIQLNSEVAADEMTTVGERVADLLIFGAKQ